MKDGTYWYREQAKFANGEWTKWTIAEVCDGYVHFGERQTTLVWRHYAATLESEGLAWEVKPIEAPGNYESAMSLPEAMAHAHEMTRADGFTRPACVRALLEHIYDQDKTITDLVDAQG